MIGTPLAREATTTAPTAPAVRPSARPRSAAPPVLIEVPALRVSRSRRLRKAPGHRPAAVRPRRRLRREIRLAGLLVLVGAAALSAAVVLRVMAPGPAPAEGPVGGPADPGPSAIELEVPIPEPSDAIEPDGRFELLPVAFPGYLLPGENDGDEEHGHERP